MSRRIRFGDRVKLASGYTLGTVRRGARVYYEVVWDQPKIGRLTEAERTEIRHVRDLVRVTLAGAKRL